MRDPRLEGVVVILDGQVQVQDETDSGHTNSACSYMPCLKSAKKLILESLVLHDQSVAKKAAMKQVLMLQFMSRAGLMLLAC